MRHQFALLLLTFVAKTNVIGQQYNQYQYNQYQNRNPNQNQYQNANQNQYQQQNQQQNQNPYEYQYKKANQYYTNYRYNRQGYKDQTQNQAEEEAQAYEDYQNQDDQEKAQQQYQYQSQGLYQYQNQYGQQVQGYQGFDYSKWSGNRGYYDENYNPNNYRSEQSEEEVEEEEEEEGEEEMDEDEVEEGEANQRYNWGGYNNGGNSYANNNNNNNNNAKSQAYKQQKGYFYFDGMAECTGSSYNLFLTDIDINCDQCLFSKDITITGTINTTSPLPRFIQLIPKICDGSGSDCTGALIQNSYINLCNPVTDCKEPGVHNFTIKFQIPLDDGSYAVESDEDQNVDQYQNYGGVSYNGGANGGNGYQGGAYGGNGGYNGGGAYNGGGNRRNLWYYSRYSKYQTHSFLLKVFMRPVTNFNLWKALTGNQDDDYVNDDPEYWEQGEEEEPYCECRTEQDYEDLYEQFVEIWQQQQYYQNQQQTQYYQQQQYDYYSQQNSQQQYLQQYNWNGQKQQYKDEYQQYQQQQQEDFSQYYQEYQDWQFQDQYQYWLKQQDCECDEYNYQSQQYARYQNGYSKNGQNGNHRYRYYTKQQYQDYDQQKQTKWQETNTWRQEFYQNPRGHMYCYMHFGLVNRNDLNLTAYVSMPGRSSWWKKGRKYYSYNDFRRYFQYVFASLGVGSFLGLLIHATGKRRRLICACDEDTTIKDRGSNEDGDGDEIRSDVEEQRPAAPSELVRVSEGILTGTKPDVPKEDRPGTPNAVKPETPKLPNHAPTTRGKREVKTLASKARRTQATAATSLLDSELPPEKPKRKKRSLKQATLDILPPKPRRSKSKSKSKSSNTISDYVLFR